MKTSWPRRYAGLFLALALGPVALVRGDVTLHDFEKSAESWENEATRPVAAYQSTNMAHRGSGSLAFDFHFGKGSQQLHVRCKEGYPKDFSSQATFRGISAWVYVSLGDASAKVANFEVQMFARSGDGWQWTTGDLITELGLGWVKVSIRSDQIFDLAQVQDIGIQVRNNINDVKATIFIDQVEALGIAPDTTDE
jgi:hypothetical protein